jgi:hypothetical protein
MPLSQGELDYVRRQAIIDAGRRAPRKTMAGGDGRMIRSVPFEAYHNAVSQGESPKDEGYWQDMDRRYPEIVVKTQGKTRVSLAGMELARSGDCRANLVRTRLGWARRYHYV